MNTPGTPGAQWANSERTKRRLEEYRARSSLTRNARTPANNMTAVRALACPPSSCTTEKLRAAPCAFSVLDAAD